MNHFLRRDSLRCKTHLTVNRGLRSGRGSRTRILFRFILAASSGRRRREQMTVTEVCARVHGLLNFSIHGKRRKKGEGAGEEREREREKRGGRKKCVCILPTFRLRLASRAVFATIATYCAEQSQDSVRTPAWKVLFILQPTPANHLNCGIT